MKEKMRRSWNAFVQYLDFNRKTIIGNLIIFIVITFSLLLIDLLTKQFLFKWGNDGYGMHQGNSEYSHKNWLFGIRSVFNTGLTANFLNKVPLWLIHIFNFIILFACVAFLITLKSKWFAVFIAFMFAGTLGNMIDRFLFNGVRDIIFIPWMDKGTFNFADVDAIIGVIGVIITLIVFLFKNDHGIWIRR